MSFVSDFLAFLDEQGRTHGGGARDRTPVGALRPKKVDFEGFLR